jgi:hypothetical protein
MNDPDLSCKRERRRQDVRAHSLFGLDYVEVSDNQLTLNVYFLGKAPKKIGKANLSLAGGRRILDVQIVDALVHRQADPTLDDYLEVRVNKPGDFSTYTLSVVQVDEQGHPTGQPMEGFDPRYDEVSFTFKSGCPSDFDCKQPTVCPPPRRTEPEINYLAKDYQSFRQLILDRLAFTMPDWKETHAPDLGITLVELLAYVGDYLSYYQDAVATEAYLSTARERISIRRHARLVDYAMHDGCNARAWVTIGMSKTDLDQEIDPTQIYFITAFPGAPDNHVLTPADLVKVAPSSYEVFEPLGTNSGEKISIYAAHSEIDFYTWGDCQCCLAPGATSATLVDYWVPEPKDDQGDKKDKKKKKDQGETSSQETITAPIPAGSDPPGFGRALKNLQAGDVLIFEEVLGPKTGNPADADPKHRQAVRLTKMTPALDPLYHSEGQELPQPVVEIEWDPADALTFPLCLSSQAPPPDCACMKNVSVARGNVILVDNGGRTGEQLGTVPTRSTTPRCPTDCEPATVEILPYLFRPKLTQQPLTSCQPLPPPCSAVDLIVQDPRQALPWISLESIPPGPSCSGADSTGVCNAPAPPPLCEVQPLFTFADLDDPTELARSLLLNRQDDPTLEFLWSQLSAETRQSFASTKWDGTSPLPGEIRTPLLNDLHSLLETWSPRRDLLESGPEDRDFVVEMDNDGYAHLRFGDGLLGRQPDAGTAFLASYRIGNGKAGNVGAETITYLVMRQEKLSGVNWLPRNPLPARGGTDPEPIADVKLFAPYSFKSVLNRAITADDYAAIAQDNGRRRELRQTLEASIPEICGVLFQQVQRAKSVLRWTGSWYTALVALDPAGQEGADQALIDEITDYLAPFRRMGHDLLIAPAQYVPLKVSLTVCVLPNYLRGHVEAAVLDVLSNRVLPDGSLGFFHPDNLTFGQGIYVSRLLAAVQALPGVQNVKVTELERFEISEPSVDIADEELPANSVLTLGPLEIARLDNDPDFPENGSLAVDMRGGR